jgi:hypothetical protein
MSKTIVPGLPLEGFVRMQQIVGDPGISEEQAARQSTPGLRLMGRPAPSRASSGSPASRRFACGRVSHGQARTA